MRELSVRTEKAQARAHDSIETLAIMAGVHWQRFAGLCAFVCALFLYRSFEDRSILGLWSARYAVILASGTMLVVICIGLELCRRGHATQSSVWQRIFDSGFLIWGVSYLLSAIDDSDTAARILDLNFVGSVAPLPALGEWVAMVLMTVGVVSWAATRLGEGGRKVLLSLAACISVVLLGEGALRLRAIVWPQTQGFPTYTSAQWTRRYVDLNREGFRDIDHPLETPDGVRRFLVVGDSFAFGSGIDEIEGRLGEQLAHQLSERLGEPWQSISAALSDSDTLDEIGYLEQMHTYQRDAVLLIYVFNDIDYLAQVTSRSVITEHQGGLLRRLQPARVLFLNSYLFQELFVRVRMARYALAGTHSQDESPYSNPTLLARHVEDLARFVDLASADDVRVWIVPFDMEKSDRVTDFEQTLKARGLPVLSLSDAFSGQASSALRVNLLDGHPNVYANELAAEVLGNEISKLERGSP